GSHAKLNGDDLLFTSSDSSTKLAHEIEKYTSGTGELIAWVKTDLSSTADTVLYMYYGNAAASNQENPTAVWSNDFVSVWHMKEDPGPGGVDEIKDSLGVNHGNAETSMETEDQVPGQIDGSLDFDGGDDKIYIGATGMPTDTFTFGGWIKSSDTHEIDTESTSGTDGISGQKYAFSADHQGSDAGAGLSVGTNGISVYEHGESYLPAIAVYSSSIGSDWNYILVVYDSKQPTIYLNGVAVHTGLTSPRPTVYVHSKIGGGSYGHLNGIIDEARISSTARTAGWIATTYNNQDAPSTFMGFEDEEGNTVTWDGGGGVDTDWSTAANWTNDTVPTAGDIAVFDNTSDNNCVIDAAITVGGIDINAGYDGAISQGANIVTVSNFEQDAGTFTGGSAAININSNFVLGAGAFTATSGTTTISGSFTKTGGTFTHNSGTVTFNGTSGTIGITSGGATFHTLAFNDNAGSATFELKDALDVDGDLTITDGILDTGDGLNYAITVDGNFAQAAAGQCEARGSTITVAGDFTADGTSDSTDYNSASLVLTGTGGLTYNNLATFWNNGFYNLNTGDSGNTTTLNSDFAVRNVLTVGSGTFTEGSSIYLTSSGDVLSFDGNSTLSIGYLKFHGVNQNIPSLTNGYDCYIYCSYDGNTVTQTGNVVINGSNDLRVDGDGIVARVATYVTAGFDLTVGGDIRVGVGNDTGLKTLNGTNSSITVGGDFDIKDIGSGSQQAVFTSTGSTVTLNGTAAQIIRSSGSSFNALVINNSSAGAVTLQDALDAGGDFTITLGTLDANDQDITVAGNVLVDTSGILQAGSGTITVAGNWTSSAGTFTKETSNVVLSGSSTLDNGGLGWWENRFNNLSMGASGQTTTLNEVVGVQGVLTIASDGVVSGTGNINLYGSFANPLTAASVQVDEIAYLSSESINIKEGDYTGSNTLKIYSWRTATSLTKTLQGDIIAPALIVTNNPGRDGGGTCILDTAGYSITATSLTVGESDLVDYGKIIANGSTIDINGDVTVYGHASNIIDADTSSWTVSGNWDNQGGTFTADSGTVMLNAASGSKTLTPGGSAFNNLRLNDGLVGYWKLDETEANSCAGGVNDACDASGYGNDGTWNGNPAAGSDIPDVNFADSRSLEFDGDNYLDIPSLDNTNFPQIAGTITFFVKGDFTTESICNIFDDWSGSRNHIFVRTFPTYVQVYAQHTVDDYIAGGSISGVFNDNEWNHVAIAYNTAADTFKVYVNGNLEEDDTITNADWVPDGQNVIFASGDGFIGLLDDVRIYNRALSGTEIQALADGNHPAASVATYTLADGLDVNGDMIISSGTLATANNNINAAGSWINDGGVFTAGSGMVTLDAASGTETIKDFGAFNDLTLNDANNGVTFELNAPLDVDGALT
ncbi:MAG: DUF2341 domain-containing protein, partial [Candidatus Omnitrophica bacterium]|nr:DUF2341 domain-containing protein [Candidatus Omnitrophota bacterium]